VNFATDLRQDNRSYDTRQAALAMPAAVWFNRQRSEKTNVRNQNTKFAASAAVTHETGNFDSKDSV
jgi:hypothetical protein